jgi:hypothetical protein
MIVAAGLVLVAIGRSPWEGKRLLTQGHLLLGSRREAEDSTRGRPPSF